MTRAAKAYAVVFVMSPAERYLLFGHGVQYKHTASNPFILRSKEVSASSLFLRIPSRIMYMPSVPNEFCFRLRLVRLVFTSSIFAMLCATSVRAPVLPLANPPRQFS